MGMTLALHCGLRLAAKDTALGIAGEIGAQDTLKRMAAVAARFAAAGLDLQSIHQIDDIVGALGWRRFLDCMARRGHRTAARPPGGPSEARRASRERGAGGRPTRTRKPYSAPQRPGPGQTATASIGRYVTPEILINPRKQDWRGTEDR